MKTIPKPRRISWKRFCMNLASELAKFDGQCVLVADLGNGNLAFTGKKKVN